MLISKKTRVRTQKRVHFQKFLQSLASVVAAAPMFLLILALCCRSTCQFRGNSEKSNHMLGATSHNELEFLTKFLNMSKWQNRLCQKVPLHTIPGETKGIPRFSFFRHCETFFEKEIPQSVPPSVF